jgi:hypothetical protein
MEMERNFNMEIVLNKPNEPDTFVYETTKIEDEKKQTVVNTLVSKVGTIEVLIEALSIASQVQRNSLENALQECEEAVVKIKSNKPAEEEALDEAPVEESSED